MASFLSLLLVDCCALVALHAAATLALILSVTTSSVTITPPVTRIAVTVTVTGTVVLDLDVAPFLHSCRVGPARQVLEHHALEALERRCFETKCSLFGKKLWKYYFFGIDGPGVHQTVEMVGVLSV